MHLHSIQRVELGRTLTFPTVLLLRAVALLVRVLLLCALPHAAPVWATNSTREFDVMQAGALGDGVTDCTGAFQAVLDATGKAGGGVVDVPAGRFRVSGHLVVPANTTLQGVFRAMPTSGPRPILKLEGSVLLAVEGRGQTNGPPFIKLAGNNASIAGLFIAYPDWKQTDVPPIPYPPCVAAQDAENVAIQDCCLLNPYEGIRLVRAARHLVRNVSGYPIWRGIFVDECYDIGRIENVHFWPFGVNYQPEDAFCRWVNTQGTAFEFARTDWHYVLNTFCFGYGIGYKFSQSKHGSANGNFLGLGADSCERAVVVDQAQPPGLLISNGEFVGRWSSTNSVCLTVGPEVEGKVSLVNCSFWGPIDRCVWMRSPSGQFTASACHFVQWDNGGVGSPAIQLDAGRAIVQGCTFAADNLHVQVGGQVASAILTANQAPAGFRVENHAGTRAQISLNEPDPVQWTDAARAHYRIAVGAAGDGRYLQNWNGPERLPAPFRWSLSHSRLILPVTPGKAYELTLELQLPAEAASPDTGLYLDGHLIASVNASGAIKARIPPSARDRLPIELRCRSWVPRATRAGSDDSRSLGVQVFAVTMRAEGAGDRVFNACSGDWIGPSAGVTTPDSR